MTRGRPRNPDRDHPLHRLWRRVRYRWGCKDERWSDFRAFLNDVGRRPGNALLVRRDPERPIGPDNFTWMSRSDAAARTHRRGKIKRGPNRQRPKRKVIEIGGFRQIV